MDEPGASGPARFGVPFDRLLEGLGVAVALIDRDGRVQTANRRAREILAILGEWTSAGGVTPAVSETAVEVIDERGEPVPAGGLPSERTLRTGLAEANVPLGLRRADTAFTWVLASTEPLVDPDEPASTAVICTFVDVTEQRDAQKALQASEERFRFLAENAIDVIYRLRVAPEPHFDYLNPAVQSLLGYTPDDFYAEPGLLTDVLHPDDRDRARDLARDDDATARTVLLRMTRRDGTMVWTEHRVVPLRDAQGTTLALEGIARDVTALKVKEAVLNHRALHDPLTGLANRVLLLDRLEHALARARRHPSYLAVLYLDLDRFKTVNDNLGHDVGDRLLGVVARRLQDTIRPSDSIARLGGDEFAAVLPDLRDPDEALQIAERLLTAVAAPVDLGEGAIVTTVSVGVAGAGDGVASAAELLRRADFAMYAAKDRGRARVECYDALDPHDGPLAGGS
ncbi:MAG: diguanylate cyclase domain-containing protein [Acidimicrobiia bacterium]